MKPQASPSFKIKSLHAFLWGQNSNYFTEQQIILALFYFFSKIIMAWVMLNEKREI